MKKALFSAFGGLEKKYLVKQYIIGIVICVFYANIVMKYGQGLGILTIITFGINTILYPYSQYLFGLVAGCVFGSTRFDLSSIVLLIAKLLSVILCWTGAVFIAPLGLAYIHYRKGRKKN